MKMKKPTYLDQAAILKWMKSKDIHVVGSLFEADQQMVKLEQDGAVDGILSEDGDIVALGGKLVLAKLSRKSNGKFQVKAFDRAEFMQSDNPYNSKLCKYPGIETHCALLLGNDYHHISGNGEVTVLGTKESSYNTTGARKDNGMLDKLDGADDKLEWVKKFGQKGTKKLSPEVFNRYKDSYKYMLHSPTLGLDDKGNATIEPLNGLPVEYLSWTDLLGSDLGLGELLHDTNALSAIYNCDVLPMTRKPLVVYDAELSRPCLFQSLDFDAHPINVQPKLCIVNWLRARGMDARVSDSRFELESLVRSCLDKDKPVQANVLKPIVGIHDGFHKIQMRLAGNDLDTPSQKYVALMKKFELISDDVIDRELGNRQGKPCIRSRVKKLINSGNFHASSIRCRNVQCKETSIPCILCTIECLSSKTSVIHTIYAVFEDKDGGRFMRDLSSCSCKKGSLFCSHCIGFLYLISIVQCCVPAVQVSGVSPERNFESNYRVSPQVSAAVPMMIENVCAIDAFNRSVSQRKRQKNCSESSRQLSLMR